MLSTADRDRMLRAGAALLALLLLAFVLYGSLFPFSWRSDWHGNPVMHLLKSIKKLHPDPRDVLINLALYAPPALFGALALKGRRPVLAMTVAAGCISLAVELAQAYIPDRFSSVLDLTLNTAGAWIAARVAVRLPPLPTAGWRPARLLAQPAAAALLLAWAGAGLYPYLPSLDPRKYWNSLYYLFQASPLPPASCAKAVVDWLVVAVLAAALAGRRHAPVAVPALFALLFLGQVVTVHQVIWPAHALGAALALGLWLVLPWHNRWARLALAGVTLAAVIAMRLDAPGLAAAPGWAEWLPFAQFADQSYGRIGVTVLERLFRLGAVLWLASAGGLRLPPVATGVAALLILTESVRMAMGLRADGTDAALLLMAASAGTLLSRGVRGPALPQGGAGS
jgi:VanZ family protein